MSWKIREIFVMPKIFDFCACQTAKPRTRYAEGGIKINYDISYYKIYFVFIIFNIEIKRFMNKTTRFINKLYLLLPKLLGAFEAS